MEKPESLTVGFGVRLYSRYDDNPVNEGKYALWQFITERSRREWL